MNVALVARVHAALLQPYRAKLLFGDPKLTGAEPTQGFLVRLRVQWQLELMNPKHEHTPKSFCQIFVTKSREKHDLCILTHPKIGRKGKKSRRGGSIRAH